MNSKLWILTDAYWPEVTPAARTMTQLGEYLAGSRKVCVLCAPAADMEQPGTHSGVEIVPCPPYFLRRWPEWMPMSRTVGVAARMFFRAVLRMRRGDTLLTTATPSLLPVLAAAIAFLRRTTYSVVDEGARPAAAARPESESFWLRLLWRWNRIALGRAVYLFSLGRTFPDEFAGLPNHVRFAPQGGSGSFSRRAPSRHTPAPTLSNEELQAIENML